MATGSDRQSGGDAATVTARLARLEEALEALGREVRTRRLIVLDDARGPRIIGEVADGVAEVRVELGPSPAGASPSVLVFAADGTGGGLGLDPAVGVQLWADGGGVIELTASPDADGRWRPRLHVWNGQ
jgi:hypothetical protein